LGKFWHRKPWRIGWGGKSVLASCSRIWLHLFSLYFVKTFGIGMVGCGVVGGGVLRNLARNHGLLAERCGAGFKVERVAVRDPGRSRANLKAPVTDDWREVVDDPKVDFVLELMGGTTVAFEVAKAALEAGKPLITANKALLAEKGEELFALADSAKVPIYFEASVAGGIPIVKALREGLCANHINRVHGIINGTCNYILSRMAEEGLEYSVVLAEAKKLGYAEADESLDVDGIDAAHKATILASLAYGFCVPFHAVYVEGIRLVEGLDVQMARRLGYGIKLLATIESHPHGAASVRVHPTLIPLKHVLASVGGVYNAVAVEGDVVGSTLFYGRGAGPDPTASAVLGDLAEAAGDRLHGGRRGFVPHNLYGKVLTMAEVVTRYYLRLTVENQPGVLAEVAAIFGKHGIGISSVFQPEDHDDETVPLVLLMDYAKESTMQAALAEAKGLTVVRDPCRLIRVEDFS
jgi:homoserine dehydrogenase